MIFEALKALISVDHDLIFSCLEKLVTLSKCYHTKYLCVIYIQKIL
ncbi:hypothetical protein MICAC_2670011 [Microcystis aeruginosa PCC 9443]|uniref:Uncharacterized protein n=1 Tax=Microcystis aeruginosa PCC 9443 TaxID=1160281 RepID=I4G1N2_MICAE|nr:hypothetical protein MICAC_2670011 [Microcystis aeruginosa PCC 9443]